MDRQNLGPTFSDHKVNSYVPEAMGHCEKLQQKSMYVPVGYNLALKIVVRTTIAPTRPVPLHSQSALLLSNTK